MASELLRKVLQHNKSSTKVYYVNQGARQNKKSLWKEEMCVCGANPKFAIQF